MADSLHLNLDDAWRSLVPEMRTVDATKWGPQLRFSAPRNVVERFYAEQGEQLTPFILYGSGDFHHLTALWIRRAAGPLVVVSFDNHPDWDVRPPYWCCGSWVNRALEQPHVAKVCVWGCGNFECWWPTQAFGNRAAERAGKLDVHAWADGQKPSRQKRRGVIFAATWRDQFTRFATGLRGTNVYVTIDLDCLRSGDAVTNWENGKFALEDVAWALEVLRSEARIVGGDMCGAYSIPSYARRKQRFLSEMDHPKLPAPDRQEAERINLRAFERLWPLLAQPF
ncbi:MAG: hypothetical protein M3Y69_01045 [Verrucomicrobiota bacterium]|nr:hypothetical protein [Verrucomicrobiota bacterium]